MYDRTLQISIPEIKLSKNRCLQIVGAFKKQEAVNTYREHPKSLKNSTGLAGQYRTLKPLYFLEIPVFL